MQNKIKAHKFFSNTLVILAALSFLFGILYISDYSDQFFRLNAELKIVFIIFSLMYVIEIACAFKGAYVFYKRKEFNKYLLFTTAFFSCTFALNNMDFPFLIINLALTFYFTIFDGQIGFGINFIGLTLFITWIVLNSKNHEQKTALSNS